MKIEKAWSRGTSSVFSAMCDIRLIALTNIGTKKRQYWSVGAAIHCAQRWVERGSRWHKRRCGDVYPATPIFGRNELLPLPFVEPGMSDEG